MTEAKAVIAQVPRLSILRSVSGGEWTPTTDLPSLAEMSASRAVFWATGDSSQMTPEEIIEVARKLDLDPMAVEDVLHGRQRPKFEPYQSHLFGIVHQLDDVDGQLEAHQIACFLGPSYVLTLHESATRVIDATIEQMRRDQDPGTPAYLIHRLVDVVVDDYQAIADGLEGEVEELEAQALGDDSPPLKWKLYSVKQRVSRLRRYALPVGRALEDVVDQEIEIFPPETSHLFRNVHDHVMRMGDQIRSIDDLSEAVIDLARADRADALNDVTKKLTSWAAIIAVPTFIASIYGMNFDLIPKPGAIFGFWFSLTLMAVTAILLYIVFKRKDWI
ncbi:MAG: magnesium transporter CorA family protein [Actinomycetota bacterium]|nr:magnesium transporter CorA family protein [Actinomycetota bacterium]